MIKMVAVLKKKVGMSREDFIEYYETKHVPLVRAQQGPALIDYRRSYVIPGQSVAGGEIEDFDVITECFYRDEAARDDALARLLAPEANAARAADEANFLERDHIRCFFVDERQV